MKEVLEDMFSAEDHNALMQALKNAASEDKQDIYEYMSTIPKTSFVSEIILCLRELGYRIEKIPPQVQHNPMCTGGTVSCRCPKQ